MIETVGSLRKALAQYPDSAKILVSGCYGSEAEIEKLEEEKENRTCGECKGKYTDIKVWIRTDLMTG